ncbi:MAG: glycosyltransferase family 39 protein [Candidatus Omnitrophica bacterium]|nr:glycosyltransferase family 39 protein [Candidatus Omnitrophota bacterium]
MKRKTLLLLLILAFAFFLRLFFFVGCIGSDDIVHSYSAYKIMLGDWSFREGIGNPIAALRLGMTLPVALLFTLFGISEVTSVLFPLLCSLSGILLIFYFGKILINEKVGFIAAFLLALEPNNIINATVLLPDLPLSFFQAVTVFLFLRADTSPKDKKTPFMFFISGLGIGYCWLVKETGLQIGILLALYVFYKIYTRSFKKEYWMILLGLSTIIITESFLFYTVSGTPFFRPASIMNSLNKYAARAQTIYVHVDFLDKIAVTLKKVISENSTFLFSVILFSVSSIYLLIKKKKNCYFLILWSFLIVMVLIGSFTKTYSYQPRRLLVLDFPVILIISIFLAELRILKNKFIIYGLMISLTIGMLFGMLKAPGKLRYSRDTLHVTREIKKFIDTVKDKDVYVDGRTAKNIYFLNKFIWKNNLKIYPSGGYLRPEQASVDLEKIENGYVALDLRIINWLARGQAFEDSTGAMFPEEVYNPPRNWQLVESIEHPHGSGDALIYYVGNSTDIFFEREDIPLPFSDSDGDKNAISDSYSVFSYQKDAQFSYSVTPEEDDSLRTISIEDVSGDEVWFILGKGKFSYAPSHYNIKDYTIEPNTLYQIEADLRSTPGIKSLEMYFFQYGSDGKKNNASYRYIDSTFKFKKFGLRIKTNSASREYRIGFKIRGKGGVFLRQIKIYKINAHDVRS